MASLLKTLIILVSLMLVSACRPAAGEASDLALEPSQIGSCGLGLLPTLSDQEAVAALLKAEGNFVVSQDIDALMHLWVGDGRIADAKHTADNPNDDQTWQGAEAIRHRYVRWVFPGAPAIAQPSDLDISVQGERAVVTGTTRIGDEVSPAGDRWELVKLGECWAIQELVFNLEPP